MEFTSEAWIETWYLPNLVYTYYLGRDYNSTLFVFNSVYDQISTCDFQFQIIDKLIQLEEISRNQSSQIKFIEQGEDLYGDGFIIGISKFQDKYRMYLRLSKSVKRR